MRQYDDQELNEDLIDVFPTVSALQRGYRSDDDIELHGEWGPDERFCLHTGFGSYLIARQYFGPYLPGPEQQSLQTAPEIIAKNADQAIRCAQSLMRTGSPAQSSQSAADRIRARSILYSAIFGVGRDEKIIHRIVEMSDPAHLPLMTRKSHGSDDLSEHECDSPLGHGSESRTRSKTSFEASLSVKTAGVDRAADVHQD